MIVAEVSDMCTIICIFGHGKRNTVAEMKITLLQKNFKGWVQILLSGPTVKF